MEQLDFYEVIQAVGGSSVYKPEAFSLLNICTDSRKIKKGDLYIALVGETFDGHDFVEGAFNSGAAGAIVSKPSAFEATHPIIRVEDTLKALQQLAAYYRDKLAKPVVAVTGSVGKTSTKDIIAAILSAKLSVHKSIGNMNNHIGMPLTILGTETSHDVTVVEMGMRGLGEISELTHIAKPSIAVITNIGLSHIERLGSQENILRAKLEILEGLKEDGLLILNANDPFLGSLSRSIAPKVVTVGIDVAADYQATNVKDYAESGVGFDLEIDGKTLEIRVPVPGRHTISNALIGIACGRAIGMSMEEILQGISQYESGKMRLDILEKGGISFINDSYNASPDSMRAGLQVLQSLAKGKRSIAILGNMFELGHMAKEAHTNVGKMCKEFGIEFSALIGENAEDMAAGIGEAKRYKIFKSHEEIVAYMKAFLKAGDVVLVKGSRGMQMERILELWDK